MIENRIVYSQLLQTVIGANRGNVLVFPDLAQSLA